MFLDEWQIRKFHIRQRVEEPENQSQKIFNDPYLRLIYENIMQDVLELSNIESLNCPLIVELGSAGGITERLGLNIITSDIRKSGSNSLVMDAQEMELEDASVDLFIAKDVLHHLPDVSRHFEEVSRTLSSKGKIFYIEPNWNLVSRVVFTFFHPEPYLKKSLNWDFVSSNPMFSNQALAWIIFCRDKDIWERRFPDLKYSILDSRTGLDFLLSGGVYRRNSIRLETLVRIRNALTKIHLDKYFHIARIIVVEKR
jgi:SAM-dependent methyltransferase